MLCVGAGKGRETIHRFFTEHLSEWGKNRIRWASSDMSRAHTEAVDEVRKGEWHALGTEQRKSIKGLRWLLWMHSAHHSKRQTCLWNRMCNSNRRIQRDRGLKDEFAQFWGYSYKASAENFLRRWMIAALRGRIPSLRTFGGTLCEHVYNILALVDRNFTNLVGERINCFIKTVKNRASGVRRLRKFADLICLVVGELDIPEKIPSTLKAI